MMDRILRSVIGWAFSVGAWRSDTRGSISEDSTGLESKGCIL